MKKLVVDGDVLKIQHQNNFHLTNAMEIYSCFVSKKNGWKKLAPDMDTSVSTLKFSKFPVDYLAVLEISPSLRLPTINFIAKTQMGEQFKISSVAFLSGQVIHNGTWFPAEKNSLDSILTILKNSTFDLETGNIETLRGVLNLKKAALNGESIIDNLTGDSYQNLFLDKIYNTKPKGLNAKLYPYQIDGWRWLKFISHEQLGGILADEMGLGKTLQIISLLNEFKEIGKKNNLIIAPGSLLENWSREIKKFCPNLIVLKQQGSLRTGDPSEIIGYDVVLISYETAIRDIAILRVNKWNVVILDEAQHIRNPSTRRANVVKQIPRISGIAVTGTPLENRLLDLWSIMDFAFPNFLGDQKSFESQYINNVEAAEKLETLVTPLILRRRISEVATDLPKRIDIVEILEMNQDEARCYETVRDSISKQYKDSATLVTLTRLRQFCAYPRITNIDKFNSIKKFTKLERLTEILGEIFGFGEKVLIFTSYTKMADKIKNMVNSEFNSMAWILDGRVSIEDRQQLIDHFTSLHGVAAMILNPQVGATGLNISAANHVIHYNPEWNPATEDQASARAYRRGQNKPVTIRRLIFANTVEEVINERLQRKRELANSAISGIVGIEDEKSDILDALVRSPYLKKDDLS